MTAGPKMWYKAANISVFLREGPIYESYLSSVFSSVVWLPQLPTTLPISATAMSTAILTAESFMLLIFIWYLSSFPRNYYLARKTGLPIFLCPVNPANPYWLALSAILEPVLAKYLPSVVYDRIKVAIFGWEFRCRYTVHAKLGPVFVLVTPARNEIWIADPEMAQAILSRWRDFSQLEMSSRMFFIRVTRAPSLAEPTSGIMSLFGQNITSVSVLILVL